MTSIIVKTDSDLTRSHNLQSGAISIGRAGDNDLHIPDITVSSYHARIFTYLEASYIEDLGSTNGTYLNGRRITKHTLHPGDVIRMGKQELEIVQNS